MRQLIGLVAGAMVFCTLVFAEEGEKRQSAEEQAIAASSSTTSQTTSPMPPGLAKQDKVPPGLEKKGKTPHGWSQGRKTGWGQHPPAHPGPSSARENRGVFSHGQSGNANPGLGRGHR